MITEAVTTGIHHPKIWFGQRSLPEASGLVPGFAHVTQYHVYHPLSVRVSLSAIFSSMCRFLLFKVNVAFLQFLDRFSIDRSCGFFLGRRKQALSPQAASIRITKEVLDVFLDVGGEEVALYCRDTLWGLCRDDVDADDATVWLSEFDSYLDYTT